MRTKIINLYEDEQTSDTSEVKEDTREDIQLIAAVCCPYCLILITVFHKPSQKNYFLWNTSNFDRHLKHVHKNNNTCERKIKVPIEKTRKNQTNNGENSLTTSLTLSSVPKSFEKTKKEFQDNSQGNNFIASCPIKSESTTLEPAMSNLLKSNCEGYDLTTSCHITSQPKPCIEKSLLVNYSDTSGDSEDEEDSANEPHGKLVSAELAVLTYVSIFV